LQKPTLLFDKMIVTPYLIKFFFHKSQLPLIASPFGPPYDRYKVPRKFMSSTQTWLGQTFIQMKWNPCCFGISRNPLYTMTLFCGRFGHGFGDDMSKNPYGAKEQAKRNWMPCFNLILQSILKNLPEFITRNSIR